jgi:hypothetical protein
MSEQKSPAAKSAAIRHYRAPRLVKGPNLSAVTALPPGISSVNDAG